MAEMTTRLRGLLERAEKHATTKRAAEDAEREFKEYQTALADEMKGEGTTSVTRDVGPPWGEYTFVPNQTIRGIVVDEDAFLDWCNRNGRTEEIQTTTFRKRQINEIAKDAIDEGHEMPDGMDFTRTVFVTKTKKRRRKRRNKSDDLL